MNPKGKSLNTRKHMLRMDGFKKMDRIAHSYIDWTLGLQDNVLSIIFCVLKYFNSQLKV